MKKPEKLNVDGEGERPAMTGKQRAWWQGRNQTIDDYEKFLPSEDEILHINKQVANEVLERGGDTEGVLKEQTKALNKRLRGEV